MRTSHSLSWAVFACLVVVACESEPPITISGTLVGHDGQPMRMAHVHLAYPADPWDALESAQVDEDGSFVLEARASGALEMRFTGVNHGLASFPLIVDRALDLSVDVQLAVLEYEEDCAAVEVAGDFNEWSADSALAMEPQPDGTYVLTIDTEEQAVAYQLLHVAAARGSVNGTHSDRFEYDGQGDYRSIVNVVDGSVTITFDPARLVRSDAEQTIAFADPTSRAARLNAIMTEYGEQEESFYETWKESEQSYDAFEYDWSDYADGLAGRLAQEEDSLVRQALAAAFLTVAADAEVDTSASRHALDLVPPSSPVWSYLGSMVQYAVPAGLGRTGEGIPEDTAGFFDAYVAYMEQGVAEHADAEVRAFMLGGMVEVASELKRPDELIEYYDRLSSEYSDSDAAGWAREYAPDFPIQAGKPVPEFFWVSADDPGATYTREAFLGKVYVLDFWATWCVPCVATMGELHELHEEFGSKGLQIVSISFDRDSSDIREFRENRWPMPWLHTWAGSRELDTEAVAQFEIWGVPTMVLVDAEGTIVSGGTGLSPESVREELLTVFGESQ